MRILFVSGVDVGGAPASTLELARRLAARGHDVGVILGAERQPGRLYPFAYKAVIKLRRATGWAWPRAIVRGFGTGGPPPSHTSGIVVWRRPNAANALRPVMRTFNPDIIVANSHPREHLRWMLDDARSERLPLALYMREEHSITHLTVSRLGVDLVLANSRHLADQAATAGYRCFYIPSIVDVSTVQVDSSRESVTMINPVPENRPDIMRELANRRPDIPVVLQESWPLDAEWRETLASWIADLPNLFLRSRHEDPRDVYQDARVIVATYPSGRPRVVFEAQHNAIPLVALGQPALTEAVGDGGVIVPLATDHDGWVRAITNVWDDAEGYRALCDRALTHSKREEMNPDAITCRFEQAMSAVTR